MNTSKIVDPPALDKWGPVPWYWQAVSILPLLAPREVYGPHLRDVVDHLEWLDRNKSPPWRAWIKVLSTFMWLFVESLRHARRKPSSG